MTDKKLNKMLNKIFDFSRRISAVQPSPTLALNAKAVQLANQGHQVLNFAVGEPDYNTASVVVDTAVASLKGGRTRYTPSGGGLELRQAIVNKLARDNGLKFEVSQVVCGCGAKEILFHTFLSLINDGDEVLLTAPCWVSYGDQIKAAGGVPVFVPPAEDGQFPSMTQIKKYITPATKGFVVNSPNNPAGYVLSEQQLMELGEFLRQTKLWVISDEIYEYMSFDRPHVSLLKLCPDLADRFILVNGMSKGFAMTGWRVGYCAAPAAVAAMVRSLQSQSSTCIPGFIEDASVVALNAGRTLMTAELEKLRRRRDLATAEMKRLGGFKYLKPEGAFYIFIDIRAYLKRGTTSLAFSEKLLQEHFLALVPGEAFSAPGFLRLSYATTDEAIIAGIDRLHAALESSK